MKQFIRIGIEGTISPIDISQMKKIHNNVHNGDNLQSSIVSDHSYRVLILIFFATGTRDGFFQSHLTTRQN